MGGREAFGAMTVYVDKAIFPWKGKKWCHLFADTDAELHAFARRLGLRRSWFQEPPKASWRHYDITAAKRVRAIELGAVEAHWRKTIFIADCQELGLDLFFKSV